MKNNKCEQMMNEYLMLDKGEHVPFSLSRHLMTCSKCRRQINLLKNAENQVSMPLKIQAPVTDDSIQKILEQLPPAKDHFYKPLPFAGWITGGIIMIILLLIASNTNSDYNSRGLSLWYAMTVAGCVIAYCAVFVFSNIDIFIKKISTVVNNIA